MGSEAYFNKSAIIKINDNTIQKIKEKAKNISNGKYRICLHHNPEDALHEMVIVRPQGDYGRPEKHLYTSETHMIIEGKMLILVFDDVGEIQELFELSRENYYLYRMDTGIYHMSIPLTKQVVYYETKQGPFPNEGNIYADWAPEPKNEDRVVSYLKELEIKIQKYRK